MMIAAAGLVVSGGGSATRAGERPGSGFSELLASLWPADEDVVATKGGSGAAGVGWSTMRSTDAALETSTEAPALQEGGSDACQASHATSVAIAPAPQSADAIPAARDGRDADERATVLPEVLPDDAPEFPPPDTDDRGSAALSPVLSVAQPLTHPASNMPVQPAAQIPDDRPDRGRPMAVGDRVSELPVRASDDAAASVVNSMRPADVKLEGQSTPQHQVAPAQMPHRSIEQVPGVAPLPQRVFPDAVQMPHVITLPSLPFQMRRDLGGGQAETAYLVSHIASGADVNARNNDVRFILKPETLGAIEIALAHDADGTAVRMGADTPIAVQQLRSVEQNLVEAGTRNGSPFVRVDIDLASPGQRDRSARALVPPKRALQSVLGRRVGINPAMLGRFA